MREGTLIFPNQLFQNHPAIEKSRTIYLIEEILFFTQIPFHRQKLVLHRASMLSYGQVLKQKGYDVIFIESKEQMADVRFFLRCIATTVPTVHYCDPVDNWLARRIEETCTQYKIVRRQYDSPAFLLTQKEADSAISAQPPYFHHHFYINQRRRFQILLTDRGGPSGGRWSLDSENRRRLPAANRPPTPAMPSCNPFLGVAREFVSNHCSQNPGAIGNPFFGDSLLPEFYPLDCSEAANFLDDFLCHRLSHFGPYQDSMRKDALVLYHSVLSSSLNTGLITAQQIVDRVTAYQSLPNPPLSSVEGFLRQVIGWREFIRAVYMRAGTVQRTRNFLNFSRPIPSAFANATTGIFPVDCVIRRVLQSGYAHHIERLMVLGNFFLLCEFHPDEVYRWFMQFFIDAYDWVMVPNVYGMSQYADGGMMTTKPYVSSSHYLLKMGDWPPGAWQVVWDALFWRFVDRHRAVFDDNPRTQFLSRRFDGFEFSARQTHLATAETFLKKLDAD